MAKKQTEARLSADAGTQTRKVVPPRSEEAAVRHGDAEMHRQFDHDDTRGDERDMPDSRELSEEEYLVLYRDMINQSVLPDLPKIPGYHTFWATTTNSRDTLTMRRRMGYTFVTENDVRGWEGGSLKSGDHAGHIGINEMVAMKIPMRLYQMYMTESHHNQPLAEEQKLKMTAESMSQNALRDKGRIIDEDGYMDSVVQKARVPEFAG